MAKNIGLCLIATNKYDQFIEPFLNSARIHFLVGHNVTFYLFTDSKRDYGEDVVTIPIKHEPWPLVTLHRYKNIMGSKNLFLGENYLYYSDIDMLFVDKVGDEILHEGLTVVAHPGFAMFPGTGSWGNNKLSTSYTPPERRKVYVAGGWQGGSKSAFLLACSTMHMNIVQDESNGVIPEHHDETMLNKLISEISNYKLLTPEYCMVEQEHLRRLWKIDKLKPRLIALAKNHSELRK